MINNNVFVFADVISLLNDLCASCNYENSAECVKSRCLTGFSKIALEYYESRGKLNIPGADTLVPHDDYKVYDRDLLTSAIGESCKLCRQCRDNHNDDCVISLLRNSMETALWGEKIPYPGNIIQYVQLVRERDAELADYIMTIYSRKAAAGV